MARPIRRLTCGLPNYHQRRMFELSKRKELMTHTRKLNSISTVQPHLVLDLRCKQGSGKSAALQQAANLLHDARAEARIPDSAKQPTLDTMEAPPPRCPEAPPLDPVTSQIGRPCASPIYRSSHWTLSSRSQSDDPFRPHTGGEVTVAATAESTRSGHSFDTPVGGCSAPLSPCWPSDGEAVRFGRAKKSVIRVARSAP